MDLKDVKCRLKWDTERLGVLADHLEERGAEISIPVIRNVVPDLARLGPVSGLATALYHRDLINWDDVVRLSLQTASGEDLTRLIIKASTESAGRAKRVVKNLYLALLDVFLDKRNQSCHYIAMNVLWENAVEELKLPSHFSVGQEIDLGTIVTQIPQIPFPISTASELRLNLNLDSSSNEENSNLQKILMEYLESKHSLCGLVRAMMVTKGVGQYTAKLLPFHQSYPMEIFLFLNKLGKHWIEFAQFLGFTDEEVNTLSCHKTEDEIRNFSKVWRMPDLKTRKTDEVLYNVLQVAGINLEDVQLSGASPDLNIRVKFSNGSFSTQVSHGGQESPFMSSFSRRDRSVANGHHPYMRDIRNAQGSGSSERSSVDSDILHPLVRQTSQWSSAGDVDVSLSTPMSHLHSPHQRELNDVSEDSVPISPHPTSSKAVQASSPGSDPKQHPPLCQEQYVCPKQTHASSVSVTEQLSSLQLTTPIFQPGDKVSLTRRLGIGLYGEILEVDHKGKTYAAKEYRSGFISPKDLKSIFADKLINLRHPNVVPYYGVCNTDTGCAVVVMERLETNLAAFVDTETKREKRDIEPERKLSILWDVANGLAYLHSREPILVHCDLKPRNVLLTSELTAKIADCGNSHVKPILDINGRREDASYLDYQPPTEATNRDEYSDRQDVFSFGHLSLYLILQREPHPLAYPTYREDGKLKARSELQRRQTHIDKATQKIGNSTNILYPLFGFIKQCLNDEAAKRPQITEFMQRLQRT